jgi:hypothetical protein
MLKSTVRTQMQSLRLINDYTNQTEDGFIYWKQNNIGLLEDKKKILERQLKAVNDLIVLNDNAKTFSDTLSVYGKYNSIE